MTYRSCAAPGRLSNTSENVSINAAAIRCFLIWMQTYLPEKVRPMIGVSAIHDRCQVWLDKQPRIMVTTSSIYDGAVLISER